MVPSRRNCLFPEETQVLEMNVNLEAFTEYNKVNAIIQLIYFFKWHFFSICEFNGSLTSQHKTFCHITTRLSNISPFNNLPYKNKKTK